MFAAQRANQNHKAVAIAELEQELAKAITNGANGAHAQDKALAVSAQHPKQNHEAAAMAEPKQGHALLDAIWANGVDALGKIRWIIPRKSPHALAQPQAL